MTDHCATSDTKKENKDEMRKQMLQFAVDRSEFIWNTFVLATDNENGHWKSGNVELTLVDMFGIAEAFFPLRNNIVRRFKSLLWKNWKLYCQFDPYASPLELLYRRGFKESLKEFLNCIRRPRYIDHDCIMPTFYAALYDGDKSIAKMLTIRFGLSLRDVSTYNDFWAIREVCSCDPSLCFGCIMWFAKRFMFPSPYDPNNDGRDIWTKYAESRLFGMPVCVAYVLWKTYKDPIAASCVIEDFYGSYIHKDVKYISKILATVFRLENTPECIQFSRWFSERFIIHTEHPIIWGKAIDLLVDPKGEFWFHNVDTFSLFLGVVDIDFHRNDGYYDEHILSYSSVLCGIVETSKSIVDKSPVYKYYSLKDPQTGWTIPHNLYVDGFELFMICFDRGLCEYAQCMEAFMQKVDMEFKNKFMLCALLFHCRGAVKVSSLRWMFQHHKHVFSYISEHRYISGIQNIITMIVSNILNSSIQYRGELAIDILSCLIETMNGACPSEIVVWYAHVGLEDALISGSVEFFRWYMANIRSPTKQERAFYLRNLIKILRKSDNSRCDNYSEFESMLTTDTCTTNFCYTKVPYDTYPCYVEQNGVSLFEKILAESMSMQVSVHREPWPKDESDELENDCTPEQILQLITRVSAK